MSASPAKKPCPSCAAPIGLAAGMCRACNLRKHHASPLWTAREIDLLRRWYEAGGSGRVGLARLAGLLGRQKSNVSRKARELGLTNAARSKVPQLALDLGTGRASPEDRFKSFSERAKRRIEKHGHPRGALGLKHTDETKQKLSDSSKKMWADPDSKLNSPEHAQRRSDALVKRIASGAMRSGYSRGSMGKRADLENRYFRSSWEANYARYLNSLVARGAIRSWEYEPRTFVFEAIKRGTRAYTPDFLVHLIDGAHEWHEVKGWMDQKSTTRLKRMAKYYPDERIVLIREPWFRAARKSGLSASLPGWESQGRGSRGC